MGERLLFQTDEPSPPRPIAPPTHLPPDARLVRVAVERSLDAGFDDRFARGERLEDAGLTYLAGDHAEELRVGARVEVPLGRGDAVAAGYVVAVGGPELLGGLDPRRLKTVRRAAGPVLPPELVTLAAWIAAYYVTPMGMVFTAMVPAATKHGTGAKSHVLLDRAARDAQAPPPALSPTARQAWARLAALPDDVFPAEPSALAVHAGARNLGPINRLVTAGLLERVRRERVHARGDLFASIARWAVTTPPPALTAEQQAAIDRVWPPRQHSPPGFGVHLLLGVTGSGKTEVYLRLIERCLAAGRSALVLVPEIGLTPQTAGRFLGRFPAARVAVLHSGLSASARHAAWDEAHRGLARVVVGARSAVFSPLTNLGVVIVDEEHDPGYKQDSLPRYNGRDVAIKRAQLAGCPVLLGSATPSLESYANTTGPNPRSSLSRLTARVGGGTLPAVRIVDMAAERRLARERGARDLGDVIGPTLFDALRRTLDAGGQAVLLLNRRGYAGHLACADAACGWSLACHHCDVRLVLHRAGARDGQHAPRGFLRCHHCRAEQTLPRACPACSGRLTILGAGTQRAEEHVERLLRDRLGLGTDGLLARVDTDAVRSAFSLHTILERFAQGATRVLLGTQMIAKGLDIANVRLVGVLSADTALAIPDFRAAERTFQLISQVAGRAGRGAHPGEVIVQTLDPSSDAIRFAAAHDYDAFAAAELAVRHETRLPPATRMARVVCRDTDRDRAHASAESVAADLRGAPGVDVVGPMPCAIPRIADHFRFGVEITAPTARAIQDALLAVRRAGRLKADAATAVDVDPISLL